MNIPVFYIDDLQEPYGKTDGQSSLRARHNNYRVYDRRHSSNEYVAAFLRREDAEFFCDKMNEVLSLRNAA